MRLLRPSRLTLIGLLTCSALAIGACGEPPPTLDEDPVDSGASSGGDDGSVAEDAGVADTASSSSGGDDTASSSSGGDDAATDAGGSSSGNTEDSGTSSGGDDAGEADGEAVDAGPVDAGPPAKKLPLPDCAKGSCAGCEACPAGEMCLDGTTYKNDCNAICKLQAFDWPTGYNPTQGACPACKECAGHKLQCNTQKNECEECNPKDGCVSNGDSCKNNEDCKWTPVCATLKNGAKQTVDVPCEALCLDLATDAGINPKNGACKSKCSQPKPAGGGCQMNVWQPVCSKKDGKTYASKCAMQNCAKQGCHAVGQTQATSQCTEDKMELECVGECWDGDNKNWKSCGKECNPVCGIAKSGKGVNYRNTCIAKAEGAKVGDCAGITATAADKCSAQLYVDGNVPCCDDVQYEIAPNPVCAALGTGDTAEWYTFRSKAEFDCWDTKAKADKTKDQWEFKFQGPCICKCTKTKNYVCGADGFTYDNACQAKCYNGDKFTWKSGKCPGS